MQRSGGQCAVAWSASWSWQTYLLTMTCAGHRPIYSSCRNKESRPASYLQSGDRPCHDKPANHPSRPRIQPCPLYPRAFTLLRIDSEQLPTRRGASCASLNADCTQHVDLLSIAGRAVRVANITVHFGARRRCQDTDWLGLG